MHQNLEDTQDQTVLIDQVLLAEDEQAFFEQTAGKLGGLKKGEFGAHLRTALSVARPMALYRTAAIQALGSESIEVEGQRIDNAVITSNLRDLKYCFVYVATCGRELAAWKESLTSAVERFFADVFNEYALQKAGEHLRERIRAAHHIQQLANMNPGSTRGWPIEQQALIFSLLGDVRGQIGVELRDSYFMVPTHSSSGLLFETRQGYANCQLCARENCPNRSMPYLGDAHGEMMDCLAADSQQLS